MVCQMDEAGLLNSMTTQELIETCKRLQRSCEDMATLLQEFEQEQEMLMHEQDRMHTRIEKVRSRVETSKRQEDRGIIWSILNEVDTKLEVSNIFYAKAQRQAAKRRLTRPRLSQGEAQEEDEQENGPFSDSNVQQSWGCDVKLGALRQAPSRTTDILALEKWVREALCAETVAEADSVDMWMAKAQLVDLNNLADTNGWAREDPDALRPAWTGANMVAPIAEGSDEGEFGESDSNEEMTNERDPLARDSLARDSLARDSLARDSWTRTGSKEADPSRRTSLQFMQNQFSAFLDGVADVSSKLVSNPVTVEEDAEVVSLTVVLRRDAADQKWGLGWQDKEYRESGARIVKKCIEDMVAYNWNKEQEAEGYPERCIQPQDRLVSVNGKTSPIDMKTELTGDRREVVLEFHRLVYNNVAAVAQQPPLESEASDLASPGIQGPTSTPALPSKPSPVKMKASFSKAFSVYLEGQGVSTVPPPEVQTLSSGAPSNTIVSIDADDIKASAEGQAADCIIARAVEVKCFNDEDAEATSAPPRPPCKYPYGVVVQIASLTIGSVRLSWSFDWLAVPSEVQDQPGTCRAYEVFRETGHEEDEGGAALQIARKWMCTRPLLKIELPIGKRYMFKIRAILTDAPRAAPSEDSNALASASSPNAESSLGSSSADISSTCASSDREPPWVSEYSSLVEADLRHPARAAPELTKESSSSTLTESPTVSKRTTVSSDLESFMAQDHFFTMVQPKMARGAVSASNIGAAKASRSTAPGPPAMLRAHTAPVDSTVHRGDDNPLATAAPRVVSASPLNPAAEKHEIAERLRIRQGGPPVALLDASALRNRSSSIESDDGSLQQLASALRSLQRSASDRLRVDNLGEVVAEEGHHGLDVRMDASSPVRPTSKHGGSPLPSLPGDAPLATTSLTSSAKFQLLVQLADRQADTIEFSREGDTEAIMREFVARNRLREDLLLEPLLERAQLMVQSDRQEDAVDIIDLL